MKPKSNQVKYGGFSLLCTNGVEVIRLFGGWVGKKEIWICTEDRALDIYECISGRKLPGLRFGSIINGRFQQRNSQPPIAG